MRSCPYLRPRAPELRICPTLSLIRSYFMPKAPKSRIRPMRSLICPYPMPRAPKSRKHPTLPDLSLPSTEESSLQDPTPAEQSSSFNFHCTCWLVCSTMRPIWLHFKSGSFQRRSYGTFSGRSSGTSRRRSSPYGMHLTLETALQESSWRRAHTLTAQQLPKSTLHSVDSLLSCQHCITLDIAQYRPKTAPLGATISIKVMTYAMPLCLY